MEQYISKAALVAEIERRIKNLYPKGGQGMVLTKVLRDHYEDLLSFLNTLEVKEVDFHKELLSFYRHTNDSGSAIALAKHFYERGLSAINPITAADRGTAEEIIINLKRVEEDYRIDLTTEISWLMNKVKINK